MSVDADKAASVIRMLDGKSTCVDDDGSVSASDNTKFKSMTHEKNQSKKHTHTLSLAVSFW